MINEVTKESEDLERAIAKRVANGSKTPALDELLGKEESAKLMAAYLLDKEDIDADDDDD